MFKELSEKYKFSEDVIKLLYKVYGEEIEKVLKVLKTPGPYYHIRVNTLKTTRENVIRRLKEYDIKVEKHPIIPEAIRIPVRGPFKLPEAEKTIIVDKFTAESVLMGANVYAPGVIRCKGIRKGDYVKIADKFGQIVAVGMAKMSEAQILKLRRGLAVEVLHSIFKIPHIRDTEEYRMGLIYPQSIPSMVVVRELDPKPGEIIVDLTCSPGGKLSHICQLTENKARIIGVDRSIRKIRKTAENLKRLGCKNVKLLVHDSRYIDRDYPTLKADKCLIDPPCSALGVMPKIYEYKSKEEMISLAEYQKQFFKAVSKIVRVGGTIIYSVCTMTIEECEKIVEYAVKKCGLKLKSQALVLGSQGLESILEECKLTQRFHPHIHYSGYFIAKFIKKH